MAAVCASAVATGTALRCLGKRRTKSPDTEREDEKMNVITDYRPLAAVEQVPNRQAQQAYVAGPHLMDCSLPSRR